MIAGYLARVLGRSGNVDGRDPIPAAGRLPRQSQAQSSCGTAGHGRFRVLVPLLSFLGPALATMHVCAVPAFDEVHLRSFHLDPALMEAMTTSRTPTARPLRRSAMEQRIAANPALQFQEERKIFHMDRRQIVRRPESGRRAAARPVSILLVENELRFQHGPLCSHNRQGLSGYGCHRGIRQSTVTQ